MEGVEPWQVDNALDHSFPRCVMSCLATRESPIIDPQYGFDGVSTSYALIKPCADHDTLGMVIARVEELNAPAPQPLIVFELGRMRAMTKAKAEDQDSMEFLLRCYADDMRNYPADVVREACRSWARTEKFFPAWVELHSKLERLVKKRRNLLGALRTLRA